MNSLLTVLLPFFPLVLFVLLWLIKNPARNQQLFYTGVGLQSIIVLLLWWFPLPPSLLGGFIGLDPLSRLFATVNGLVFAAVAPYTTVYLRRSHHEEERTAFSIERFQALLFLFLFAMNLTSVSRHFGLLWIAIEATTLVSAPLIVFHRNARSLEAVWKYLILCSVGIALSLLGNLFLAVSNSDGGELLLDTLLNPSASFHVTWLKAAFILLLVGYGTKMGLSPMHTWLPDAHSEAPAPVSALLSGGLLNCAFLGVLRASQVASNGGLGSFASDLLILFGILSLFFAALFILGQKDYKRMLAYSSVEHMGILSYAVGISGGAATGAMMHLVNHSAIKTALFLLSGTIFLVYGTKLVEKVDGMGERLRTTGTLFLIAVLAACGFPPFGLFFSEVIIVKSAIDQDHPVSALLFLTALTAVSIGMFRITLRMFSGTSSERTKETKGLFVPSLLLLFVSAVIGVLSLTLLKPLFAAAAPLLEILP